MERISRFFESEEQRRETGKAMIEGWLGDPEMTAFLAKYGMDREYFEEHYAIPLIYSSERMERGRFVGQNLVDYLHNRDVTLVDIDRLFSTYRRSLLRVLIRSGKYSAEVIDAILADTDAQRQQALEYYAGSIFSGEKKLRQELVRFRQYQKVIDKSAIVSKTDVHGNITYVNQAFCTISGYSKEEMIGKTHRIVRHGDVLPELYKGMWETISAKKVFRGIIKNRKKNGDTYYVDATIVPILDEENEIEEYMAMRYDITALVEALESARMAERSKSEFLGNVSHEIRTPLNAIIGFISILRRQITEAPAAQYLDVIDKSSHMLLGTVNDILDFSKLQSGKFTFHSEPFDPLSELSAAVALFAPKASEKAIRYGVYIDPSLPLSLRGDSARIRQVLSNFLSNAIKFTPDGGSVKVKAFYENGTLNVMVQDTGIGVAAAKQAKIFEPFEQADGSITRSHGGTGLGLSICSQLVSMMGGEIIFKSVENKGSLFGFRIPLLLAEEGRRFDPERYAPLRIALIGERGRQETGGVIEKYLRDFGVTRIEYVQEGGDGKYDAIFCPFSSEKMGQLLRFKTPVVALRQTLAEGDNLPSGIERLSEPFMPAEFHHLLERMIVSRNKKTES